MQICHKAFGLWEFVSAIGAGHTKARNEIRVHGLAFQSAAKPCGHLDNASFNRGSLSPAACLLVQDLRITSNVISPN